MKNGQGKQVPFHGILAVGSTKDEAVNRYRLLALGKGVTAFMDQGQSVSFVTSASNTLTEMFNPKTGDLDLEKSAELAGSLKFEAKAGDVEATHYVCESGCGTHLVYDSEELVKFCPVCTSAVASAEEGHEEPDGDEDSEGEEPEEDMDEDSSAEASDEEDEDEEDLDLDPEEDGEEDAEEGDEDDTEADAEEDEEGDDSDEEGDDSDEEGDDAEEDEEAEEDDDSSSVSPLVIAAESYAKAVSIFRKHREPTSVEASDVEVNYVVCTSSDCGAHIISEVAALAECPACKSKVAEPVSVSSEDCDDEEEGDDEEDISLLDEEEGDDEDMGEEAEASAEVDPAELMDVDALSHIEDSGEEAHKDLDLSYSSAIAGASMWTAFFKGRPVATARVADAGKNVDIFDDATFGHAVIASARHVGVQNILREMGFKGLTQKAPIASIVTAGIAKEVATATAALEQDRKEYAERLLSALATAAIGVNRGFFADVKNPLKEQLWDAMSSAGIKNPETLIHNVFRASSDAYHNMLFVKASEIIAKPLEVQESLAKAVLGTNYMSSESSSSTGSGSSLEERLGEFGTATAASKSIKVEENEMSLSNSGRIASVVSSLGRRRG